MDFTSNAEKIRYYVEQLLSDEDVHNMKELKEYVQKATGEKFSSGCFAGAVRDLLDKNKSYKRVDYGKYVYIKENGLKDSMNNAIEESIDIFKQRLSKVDILSMSDEDMNIVTKIKKILNCLNEQKNNL